MSTPRFYCWDDDGSPGRALTGNMQNKLKQILIPCLVTGYGDKPGAGWAIGHEHPNGFSLVSASGNIINFVSDLPSKSPYPAIGPNTIHIYAAETITGSSEAIIEGANLSSGPFRSGTPEASGFPRHTIYVGYTLSSHLSTLQWTIIADDSSVCISLSTSLSIDSSWPESQVALYFGDTKIDSGIQNSFLAVGGANQDYSGSTYARSTFSGGNTALRNLSTGLCEFTSTVCQPYANNTSGYNLNTLGSGSLPAHLRLQPPTILAGKNLVGVLKGCAYDPILALYGWGAYLRALGFSEEDFADRGKIATIGDNDYAFLPGYYGGFIMTTDLAFW